MIQLEKSFPIWILVKPSCCVFTVHVQTLEVCPVGIRVEKLSEEALRYLDLEGLWSHSRAMPQTWPGPSDMNKRRDVFFTLNRIVTVFLYFFLWESTISMTKWCKDSDLNGAFPRDYSCWCCCLLLSYLMMFKLIGGRWLSVTATRRCRALLKHCKQ